MFIFRWWKFYVSTSDVYGFQLIDGCITGASVVMLVRLDLSKQMVQWFLLFHDRRFCFCGIRYFVELSGDVTPECTSGFIISGAMVLLVSEWATGGDDNACDVDATGVCDDVDDCIGELDECGVCNGNGTYDACDCDGNVNDRAGVCGGDSVVDECECGDGSVVLKNYLVLVMKMYVYL